MRHVVRGDFRTNPHDQCQNLKKQILPHTTERPVPKCGDECSELFPRAEPQSHGRKSVVQGLRVSFLERLEKKTGISRRERIYYF